ncbi:MAG: hypothetical protein ACI4E1_07055 [Lachnospira sp.]
MKKLEFETRAIVAGLTQKEQLDFFSAFKQIEGCSFESPLIDKDYLNKNGDRIEVALRALLQTKMGKADIDKVIMVFSELRK